MKAGVPVDNIIVAAKKANADYVIKKVYVATDRIERMLLDDSLDDTSASVVNELMLFDNVVYQVKCRTRRSDFIKYITKLLDAKYKKVIGREHEYSGNVDKRYPVYTLPNNVVVSI